MSMPNNSVTDRVEQTYIELTPAQMALGIGLVVALGVTLLFVQEPMMHEAMHNFRHTAGITCH